MRQFRVLLSAGNNTRRTSRGNTKSGVVGMWKSDHVIGARCLVHRREGKESEVVLKVRVRYCSRQCSRGESTRESDVVIALGG